MERKRKYLESFQILVRMEKPAPLREVVLRELSEAVPKTKDPLPLNPLLLQASSVSSISVYEWVGGVEAGEEKAR